MLGVAAFARYLDSLTGSWEALARPHPGADVIRGDGFVAARFPDHPVFNNAVVLEADAAPTARAVFDGIVHFALWALDDNAMVADALERMPLRRDITTRPMVCLLGGVERGDPAVRVDEIDPADVAVLNGLPPVTLQGVPGVRGYATDDGASGLVLIPVDDDVNVSFVFTSPGHRARGLAGAVTRAALVEARDRGFITASLQATPAAERLYGRMGFVPVGRWQEWIPTKED